MLECLENRSELYGVVSMKNNNYNKQQKFSLIHWFQFTSPLSNFLDTELLTVTKVICRLLKITFTIGKEETESHLYGHAVKVVHWLLKV